MAESTLTKPGSRKRKSAVRERAELFVYRAIAGMVDRGTEQSVRRYGERLGIIASRIIPGRNQVALRNLAVIFPEKSAKERAAIARECWRHYGRMTLGYLRRRNWTLDQIIEDVQIEGWNHLEKAMALERGVILVTSHFGNWEIGLNVLSKAGVRVTTVARALDNEFLEDELFRVRRRSGIELVDRRHAARPLVRALERKEIVVILPDQAVQPREGILAPFLGRPAWTTPAPARLALRYDVPVLPIVCLPAGEQSTLQIGSPLPINRLPEEQRTAEAVTALINEAISDGIRQRPELWLWMHDRWKWT